MKLNINELKENGFLQQVQKDLFSLRIKVVGGQLTGDNLQAISIIANKYGNGQVHFTSRQAVEIPFIKAEDIDEIKSFLKENNLEPGILGSRVRTITACQGAAVCKHGNIITAELADKITEAVQDKELPHKFKIGITGCFNNCLKAEENDLGIKGGVEPNWLFEKCTYCGACARKCPVNAIKVDKDKQKLKYNEDLCINCGKCVKICTKEAWAGKNGYILYFGGTFGNKILIGQRLLPLISSESELLKAIDKTLKFFQDNGKKDERFGFMLERTGVEKLQAAVKE